MANDDFADIFVSAFQAIKESNIPRDFSLEIMRGIGWSSVFECEAPVAFEEEDCDVGLEWEWERECLLGGLDERERLQVGILYRRLGRCIQAWVGGSSRVKPLETTFRVMYIPSKVRCLLCFR
jgi:hypothetical protein